MNIFDKVKSLPEKPVKTAKGKKEKVEYQINNLKTVAELSALIDKLSEEKTNLLKEINANAFDIFYNESIKAGAKIDNFIGIDNLAFASVEMKKRSSASALSVEELEVLKSAGIKTEKVVSVPELFGINPEYTKDKSLFKKVSKALKDIVPEDFFVIQEEQSKTVVAEDSLDEAFKKKSSKEVVHILSTMALKPKLKEVNLNEIYKNIKAKFFGRK